MSNGNGAYQGQQRQGHGRGGDPAVEQGDMGQDPQPALVVRYREVEKNVFLVPFADIREVKCTRPNCSSCKGEQGAQVMWLPASNGQVPPGSIAVGQEKNDPFTFFGRVPMGEDLCLGRIVPSAKSCFFVHKNMEHRR